MAEVEAPSGVSGTGAPATSSAGAGAATADAGATAGSDEPLLNKGEVVGLRKEVRQLAALVQQVVGKQETHKSTKADAIDDLGALRSRVAELDLADAIDEMGLDPSREERTVLKRLFRGDRPPDVKSWLGETAPLVIRKQVQSTTQAAATPPPKATAQLGAPATGAPAVLPSDPRQIPKDQWNALDPAKRKEIADAFVLRNGGGGGLLRGPTRKG